MSPQRGDLRRAGRLGVAAVLWTVTAYLAVLNIRYYVPDGLGLDAHAYWLAGRSDHPYGLLPGDQDAFLYTPVFALAMKPLALVPWPVFLTGWLVLESAAFLWLTAPLAWVWRVPVLLLCVPEVLLGNVYGFLGLAVVWGMRRPGFWSFAALTKLVPGLVGVLWFAVRREWGAVAKVVVWTVGLAALSLAVAPGLWSQWWGFVTSNAAGDHAVERWVRYAVLVVIVVWGARGGRAWVLPLGVLLANPHLGVRAKDVAMLAAMPRLVDPPQEPAP